MGTGLGLRIVKSFTDLMNGSVSVESKEGKGSCFTVLLPCRISGKKEPPKEQHDDKSQEKVLRNKTILLAEDNELNAEIAMTILQDAHARVEVASDGAIALSMLKEAPAGYYDVILMDIQMPHMNGYEAKAMKHLILQCFMASLFLICYWFSVKNIILIGLLCPSIGLWSYGYILCYQHLLTYVPSAYQYISCYLLHYQDWFQKCVLLHVGFYHQHLFYA